MAQALIGIPIKEPGSGFPSTGTVPGIPNIAGPVPGIPVKELCSGIPSTGPVPGIPLLLAQYQESTFYWPSTRNPLFRSNYQESLVLAQYQESLFRSNYQKSLVLAQYQDPF